ncbi:MAG: hypothetical protein ACT6QT_20020 [Sphingopyxis sp.]|jgi:hypothetical protein|uniref:hypothetical protein n=1 Tax=Sphingopyxis sp. TaxID=1908224 RepID=UPI00403715FC
MMASVGVAGMAVLLAWEEFRRRGSEGYLPQNDSSHIVSILSKMMDEKARAMRGWNAKYLRMTAVHGTLFA